MKWRTDSLVPTQAQAVMNAWEKEIVAIHESGHAIMDKSVEHADPVQESVEKLGGDAKVKAEQELAALRRKRDAVSEQLEELVDSGGSAWDQLKSGIDSAMEDLADAYTNAVAEFSKP